MVEERMKKFLLKTTYERFKPKASCSICDDDRDLER